ncbi:probable DNA-directed RNA polymerases I and III subunit RPAC2 [Diorhabda carinulata]|uniref:probable DNA-directed RNA polymerases I and III subunit RPAC2 n=1 Tax=Diorhabda sublineata TaxID=1163346 RepID=UPI0024E12381|nr:probable DNA-directed RNA polymerases I and III subunit RPAC2 [Diorhabda sublineata]XP_057660983.1 probable DNA-directed RNA polymerases I and III subunit RPAC2 [Diorhabda carinulata]
MPIAQLSGNEVLTDSAKSKTFVFQDEGHTLGNALRCIISSYPEVQFCGYTVPHPSESKMHFRIQMNNGKAIDALKKGLEDLVQLCDVTLDKFNEELKNY